MPLALNFPLPHDHPHPDSPELFPIQAEALTHSHGYMERRGPGCFVPDLCLILWVWVFYGSQVTLVKWIIQYAAFQIDAVCSDGDHNSSTVTFSPACASVCSAPSSASSPQNTHCGGDLTMALLLILHLTDCYQRRRVSCIFWLVDCIPWVWEYLMHLR